MAYDSPSRTVTLDTGTAVGVVPVVPRHSLPVAILALASAAEPTVWRAE